MFTKKSMRFLSFILIIFIYGCSTTSIVSFQTLKPANYTIINEIKKIGFIYRKVKTPYDTLKKTFTINNKISNYSIQKDSFKYSGFKAGIQEGIRKLGVIDTLVYLKVRDENKYYNRNEALQVIDDKMLTEKNCNINMEVKDTIYFIDAIIKDVNQLIVPKLNWSIIKKIANRLGVDLIISNEYSFFKNNIFWNKGVDNYLTNEVVGYNLWRIYDPNKKIIVDQSFIKDSFFWDGYFKSLDKAFEKIPNANISVEIASLENALKYLEFFIPKWKNTQREYFVMGCKEFRAASYWVNQQEYYKAYKLWMNVYKTNPKLSGKAAFNIALYYELNDNLEKTLEWLEISKKLLKQNLFFFANEYTRIIKKRIKDNKKLIKQIR